MADLVRRLVKKGLVARRKARVDARRYMLELTPAGKEVTIRAQLIAQNVETHIARQVGSAMIGFETKLKKVIAAAVVTDGSRSSLVAAE